MEEEEPTPKYFIGFDFSTQQIKAVVINEDLEVTAETQVHFDSMLPEYRTHGGVNMNGNVVTSPSIMWVKGLDMLLDKLRVAGVEFPTVAGLSGAGQQHGSVYWRTGASVMLETLQPERFLHDQLGSAFSILDSPIWMDSSTSQQCRNLEDVLGGPETLMALTGSRAYERFTGNQISKIVKEKKEAYSNTERISLVSSFAASLFLGKIADIDWADGGGMNLLNITNKQWVPQILAAIDPQDEGSRLANRLGNPVSTSSVLGTVSPYMEERYGFQSNCLVAAFTGDNCSSLAGLGIKEDELGYSLGTSDTVFAWLKEPNPQLTGHIFPNPVDDSAFMALLCYKNGSLARESVRDRVANGSWEEFNSLLDNTPRGNFGNIGFFFDLPEIIPDGVEGVYRFNKGGEPLSKFASDEIEIRALIEGQVMAKRLHAERMGFSISANTKVLVTGGASVNSAILQVIADVFGANVYTIEAANSAALGGAYRALHQYKLKQGIEIDYPSVIQKVRDEGTKLAAQPSKDAKDVYEPLIQRYAELEDYVINLKRTA